MRCSAGWSSSPRRASCWHRSLTECSTDFIWKSSQRGEAKRLRTKKLKTDFAFPGGPLLACRWARNRLNQGWFKIATLRSTMPYKDITPPAGGRIYIADGKLNVPDNPVLPFI